MDNLIKLADHLIREADKLAVQALHSGDAKHIDVVLKYCDAHQEICESLEFHEDYGGKLDGGAWDTSRHDMLDNPRRRRR